MSTSEKYFFHAPLPKYFLRGCAGEERRGEDFQIGPRNGAANQRKLDVFHLTHNTLAQPEPRMHGRLPILSLQSKDLQTLLVSAVWWEFHICFDYSKKKKKCRGFSSAYSPSCGDCRKIPTWQSAIKLSNPCMFFVYVFDRNGARRKTNMVKTLVFFFFYPFQFNCVQSPWNLRAQHKLQMYTNVCKLFLNFCFFRNVFFFFLNNNRSIRTDLVWP